MLISVKEFFRNAHKNDAATIAGGVTFFFLGFLIFGLLLGPNVMQQGMSPDTIKLFYEEPIWVPLILGNLVIAFLLVYIFEYLADIRTFAGGLIGGATILFLMDLYTQLMFSAFMRMHTSYVPVIIDIIGSTVMGALAGGVAGLVLGKMNKTSMV